MDSITAADLLTKAEEFERMAQAYRTVAMGMNGARVSPTKAKSIIDGAIELRQSQKEKEKPRKAQYKGSPSTIAERKAFLRQQLTKDGPLSTNELTARVVKHEGFELSRDRIYQNLREMSDTRLTGTRTHAVWSLKTAQKAKKVKAAKKAAKKVAAKQVAKTTKTKKSRHKQPGEKGRIVVEVLRERGPLTVKDLTAAVRKRGLDGLTGIHNYVKQGYLTRRGNSPRTWVYAVKSVPPAATAVEAATVADENYDPLVEAESAT